MKSAEANYERNFSALEAPSNKYNYDSVQHVEEKAKTGRKIFFGIRLFFVVNDGRFPFDFDVE